MKIKRVKQSGYGPLNEEAEGDWVFLTGLRCWISGRLPYIDEDMEP